MKLKTFGFFALKFILIYGVLLYLGFQYKTDFYDYFIAKANSKFETFKEDGGVIFTKTHPDVNKQKQKKKDEIWGIFYRLSERASATEKAKKQGRTNVNFQTRFSSFNVWTFVFLPFSFLMALILSTKINWKRMIFAFLGGIVLIYFFIYFKMWLYIFQNFQSEKWLQLSQMGDFSKSTLDFLAKLNGQIGTSIFVALVIWVFLCFRKSDWKNVLNKSKS